MADSKWSIRCYTDEHGDAIDTWYAQQPEALQAKFDTRLRYLRAQPPANWCPPYFKLLERECKGLGEIRFEYKNVQYRPLGFFSGSMEFTLLLVTTKKGSTFVPRNACEVSLRRASAVRSNKQGFSRECEF
jgi:hypothetical protein